MNGFMRAAVASLAIPALLCFLCVDAVADEVRLTGDRTLRGVVVRDSDEGARIKLANGEVRDVPRAEIVRITYDEPTSSTASSLRSGTTVVVITRPAAAIEIDGAPVTAEPNADGSTTRSTLPAGRHVVLARFDDGSTQEESFVVDGRAMQQVVELERSALREFERYRGGPYLVFGAGGGFAASFEGGGGASGFGAELAASFGYSIAPAFDVRLGAIATLAIDATYTKKYPYGNEQLVARPQTLFVGRGVVDAVFNFHPAYGPWFGFGAGGGSEGAVLGPRWCLLDFRVGPERGLEISMPQQLLLAELPVYVQTLDIAYLMAL